MKESEKKVREYLARIGSRGGFASRRELTKSHARQMVAIREAMATEQSARSKITQAPLSRINLS